MNASGGEIKAPEGPPPLADLNSIQAAIASIADPKDRLIAEHAFFLGKGQAQLKPKQHIVMLVHGIRTHASWQERLRNKLKAVNIEAVPIGYGIFDALRFLCPIGTRRAPQRKVERELRSLRVANPNADISVVAHSFGTYLMSQILDDATDIRIDRLLLCGSIVRSDFRWDKVRPRISGTILNDVGTRDIWPALARITWGYGPSGTLGFKTALVLDRYHDCAHSDFFSDDHMSRFWIPFLQNGHVVPTDETRPESPAHISISCRLPIKSLIGLTLLLCGGWWWWY